MKRLLIVLGTVILGCGGSTGSENCTVEAVEAGALMRCPGQEDLLIESSTPGADCFALAREEGDQLICDDGRQVTLPAPLPDVSCTVTLSNDLAVVQCDGEEPFTVAPLPSCDALVGTFTVRNDRELRALAQLKCPRIEGSLLIQGLTTESLEGLEALEEVTGRLQIEDNLRLQSLQGLSGLRTVGRLDVARNHGLSSLEGLEGLESARTLSLQNNRGLAALVDFSALTHLENLEISFNPLLTEIAGFEGIHEISGTVLLGGMAEPDGFVALPGLQNLERVGAFHLRTNRLMDLSDLAALQEVERELILSNGMELTSLAGLEGLERIGGMLMIWVNPQLESMEALQGVETFGDAWEPVTFNPYRLRVESNPSLPACQAQAFAAVHEVPEEERLIQGNDEEALCE